MLASCRQEGVAKLVWATDSSGDWRASVLPRRWSATLPDLMIDASGIPHALWTEFQSLDSRRLLHARLVAGEWGQPLVVAEGGTVGRLAFAPDGRAVVAYADGASPPGAWVTSTDGSTVAEACRIDLPIDDVARTMSLVLDGETGAPVVAAGAPFSGDEDDSLAIGWFER